MRKMIIAGNWKMYKDLNESRELVDALQSTIKIPSARLTVVVCPPFTSLSTIGSMLEASPIKLGAQNMSQHDEGAYTGEVSAKMLRACKCEFVILGHSERRQYYGETDALVNAKVRKALSASLRPIVCVGETLSERESGITHDVITRQVKGVLKDLQAPEMQHVTIAYEPVWAIGTGKTATPAQAQEVHKLIRTLVSQLFNPAVGDNLVIQYGGSVKPDNAADLLSQNDIDGALVGGACLKADSFNAIINAAK